MNEPVLELFRNACGLTVPLALDCAEAGGSTGDSALHQFDYPFVLIGRDPRSDLILDNTQISRRHSFLQAIAGRILVVDLQSRTKVYWEGEGTPRTRGWLDADQFIQVGPYRIRRAGIDAGQDQMVDRHDETSRFAHERTDAGPALRASLELPMRMGAGPSLWALDEQMVLVGRAEECQLVLTDESVSRFHAALVPTPSGVWIVDLLARDGVHVNGERVRWAWLADGDSFRMGSFTFILRYDTPPDRISRADVPLEAGAIAVDQPRNELAVRVAKPEDHQRALSVHRSGEPPVRLQAAGFARTLEPAPPPASGVGIWDPSIPFPANPMAMWQQQMQLMESFHNDMILMVQMFVAMHREHLSSVRNELDMVQKLTRELSDLQGKITQSPGSEDPASGRPSRERGSNRAEDPKKKSAKPSPGNPVEQTNRSDRKASVSAGGTRAAGEKERSANGAGAPDSAETPARGSEQIHAGLTQRIAQLQRERQGYWQRILSTINK